MYEGYMDKAKEGGLEGGRVGGHGGVKIETIVFE